MGMDVDKPNILNIKFNTFLVSLGTAQAYACFMGIYLNKTNELQITAQCAHYTNWRSDYLSYLMIGY